MISARRLFTSRPYQRCVYFISTNGMLLFVIFLLTNTLEKTSSLIINKRGLYTNEFAVKVTGGHEIARKIASELGFEFIDQIGELQNYYLFKHSSIPLRSKRRAGDHHEQSLEDEERVEWFKQQTSVIRTKRDFGGENTLKRSDNVKTFNDPQWPKQWYLHDSSSYTMNVIPVWNKQITGKGVVVTILDDGIEYAHDDLKRNYDSIASTDFNDNDDDPVPRYDGTEFNSHGTRCAGEVAMEANNEKCGVGVAFDAKIGGVRMLDGAITDALEARAFGHKIDYVDIFSSSWGPSDDGKTVEGPSELAYDALQKAIEEGRGGKGNIFVWAAGNGGYDGDNCICDGYASSIFTIAISSVENNKVPPYDERCSSIMASTYSFTAHASEKMSTVNLHNTCTSEFCGTSASAPLAAGIIALALQANPALTWRDIQHIIVWTADYEDLLKERGWYENAAGLWVNTAIGFGLMDAEAIVTMADPRTWKAVPEKNICIVSAKDNESSSTIVSDEILRVSVLTDGCAGTATHVKYLEHVEVFLNIHYPYRGALNINLTSPSGTETSLLASRERDKSAEGFYYWPFVSLHTWGEETTPEEETGEWTISVWDSINPNSEKVMYGSLTEWFLVLHGTESPPAYREVSKTPSQKKWRQNKKSSFPSEHSDSDMSSVNDVVLVKRRLESKRIWHYLHSLHRR